MKRGLPGGTATQRTLKRKREEKECKEYNRVGLLNHHNTCYFNSALQLLYATTLSDYILKFEPPFPEDTNARSTADSSAVLRAKKHLFFFNNLKATFHLLQTRKNDAISVKRLVNSFIETAPESFSKGRQEDSHEALRQMLHNIHKVTQEPAINSFNGETYQQSIVTDSFSGQLASTVQCSCCSQSNTSFSSFFDLSIEIHGPPGPPPSLITKQLQLQSPNPTLTLPNNNNCGSGGGGGSSGSSSSFISKMSAFFSNIGNSFVSSFATSGNDNFNSKTIALETCLSRFFSPEKMSGDNQYECNTCRTKTNSIKRMYMKLSSRVHLCLHLKRFNQSYDGRGRKNNRHVTFPLRNLDVKPYILSSTNATDATDATNTCLYDLVGLIRHQGFGVRSGHYVAYVKSKDDGKWYKCNDSQVALVDEKEVEEQQAYVLMYQCQDYVQQKTQQNAQQSAFSNIETLLQSSVQSPDSIDSNVCFMSSYWIKKRLLFRSPKLAGPPTNSRLLCRHGKLLSRCIERMKRDAIITPHSTPLSTILSKPIAPIPFSLYNELLLQEGYDSTTDPMSSIAPIFCSPISTTLKKCTECQKEGDQLNVRRLKEKNYFDNLRRDHPSLIKGSTKGSSNMEQPTWYLLETSWWKKWREWYLNTRCVPLADQIGRDVWGMDEDVCGVLPPGPITNDLLFYRNNVVNSNDQMDIELVPKKHLKPGVHYRGITKEVWDFFVQNHGGGPAIMRSTLRL